MSRLSDNLLPFEGPHDLSVWLGLLLALINLAWCTLWVSVGGYIVAMIIAHAIHLGWTQ